MKDLVFSACRLAISVSLCFVAHRHATRFGARDARSFAAQPGWTETANPVAGAMPRAWEAHVFPEPERPSDLGVLRAADKTSRKRAWGRMARMGPHGARPERPLCQKQKRVGWVRQSPSYHRGCHVEKAREGTYELGQRLCRRASHRDSARDRKHGVW
jgi:hypothetical protein